MDEIIDLHDRILGTLFNRAKSKHLNQFQDAGKEIHAKVRLYCRIGNALLDAKKNGSDPFAAIETVLPWEDFIQSVEAAQKCMQSENFDYLHLIGDGYSQMRRYAPEFLNALHLKAAPAAKDILHAVEILKKLNLENARNVPENASISFIRKRWENLVFKDGGIDRRFYELCVLSELKNALRSGDIWVKGSRQFRDFDEYLLPVEKFESLKELPLVVEPDCDRYLNSRLSLLEKQLETGNRLM